ncbi:hypothetical protein QAD02_004021 [Eretmocerus hayati]|uniref:Uncharacterized protein n=1 Tax=Eretmocerus hayati TaxID=131215 RepID=A0ACC2NQ68_9HYME|nr:hypothetical protein QAD02_004021 [Eretmocerus hayati]
MNKKPPTAWIQNLNKTQIIEELRTRGIPFKESESYNDLRERLRENIKSLNCTQEEGHVSDGVVSPDSSQENIAGDEILVDGHGVREDKRVSGEIIRQVSPSTFVVKTESGTLRKKHVDQMIKPELRRSRRLNSKVAGEL